MERLKSCESTGLDPEEIEAMKNNGGWIPVSERLPENRENVLICQDDGYVGVGYFSSNETWRDMHSYPYDNVIAWQPLPEPYRPKSNI